jgi:hypothetical protein
MRYRWTILISVALGVVAVLAMRYWPHLLWKVAFAKTANEVVAIPTRPLAVTPADEPMSTCTIGPVSFAIPTNMTEDVAFRRGMGGIYATFNDKTRRASIFLPQPHSRVFQDSIVGFPDKADLTFSRLYKEACEASSSDFSFSMSRREVNWHGWLMTQRLLMPGDLQLVEYSFRDDMDGHLTVVSATPVFEWDTTDLKWEGLIYFRDANTPNMATDWMRRTSASFAINGDPSVLAGLDEDAIKAMMTLSHDARDRTAK